MQNLTTTNTTLGGNPAVEFEYDSLNTRKHLIHTMEIISIIKNTIYYFDYYAEQKDYNRFLPDVINMTNNIKFNTLTNFK